MIDPHAFLDIFSVYRCKKNCLNGRNAKNADIYLSVCARNDRFGISSFCISHYFGTDAAAFTRFRTTIRQKTSAARHRVLLPYAFPLAGMYVYTRRKHFVTFCTVGVCTRHPAFLSHCFVPTVVEKPLPPHNASGRIEAVHAVATWRQRTYLHGYSREKHFGEPAAGPSRVDEMNCAFHYRD